MAYLKLHLLVVLRRESGTEAVQLEQLGFGARHLGLEIVQHLGSAARSIYLDELGNGARGLCLDAEFPHLFREVLHLPLQLVDPLDVRYIAPLEGGEARIEIHDLQHIHAPQIRDAGVRRILIHDDGDIGHVLAPEP